MRILRAGDHKRMPWKNGKGETVEVAVSPPGASINDFDWRISMATVAEDGPFSIFPGIDRTLAILDGNGMVLDVAGSSPVLLTTASDPLAFPADIPVEARLLDGAITDLNVMTRRDGLAHTLIRINVDGSKTVRLSPSTCLLLCHHGALSFRLDGETGALAAGDALLIEGATATVLEIDGEARCYLGSITAG
ncbi:MULTISPECIES: HutD/Ves family protein [Rhizobium]|uniref:HutD family protein n=2 Tax=Rhizobium laguerreae TaxID=1076926 RepID=A0AAX2QDQ2_9HYPH|nr:MULTISPECIES: HutD family protein [Rhizobium]MBY3074062.1 HutD family protein [Rhizobium laguerreae]MBY3127412.1 HutD family protein [Rhizobium laguerreae]MBY3252639.1 HutD family protein [Rhizobium laguerreae]MBY5649896.1 HutD family protein [Rhizobium leguminosarum]MBY5744702.1 HutD family protein [Rhizobium leguminosarum]